ncbi:MAG: patatin-like phospholipase family protein [Anaerolineae bacterium]|nr:patatin-like phospholipase family protein [Anaerolineae bacterium]
MKGTPSSQQNHQSNRPRIGLALSGGGIRGFAHLGVLRTLEEQAIPIDSLAGTSMGGLIAGIYGAGVPLDKMTEFATNLKIMDMASPDRSWHGFFDHRKMSKMLTDLLGSDSLTFEELKIPVSVVAADLSTGELVILDHGPLIPALMATSALPLFFAPVEHQDRTLVDGGVLNNVPFDIVRDMGADRVLAVSFETKYTLTMKPAPADGHGPSMRVLRRFRHLAPEWRQPFHIAEISAGMTQHLINQTRLELCPPDVHIKVVLDNIGILTFEAGAAAVEAGYITAQRHLSELQALTDPLPAPWQQQLAHLQRRVKLAWQVLRGPAYRRYPDR